MSSDGAERRSEDINQQAFALMRASVNLAAKSSEYFHLYMKQYQVPKLH